MTEQKTSVPLRREDEAATRLQCLTRQKLARKQSERNYWHYAFHLQEEEAAIRLQCSARRKAATRAVDAVRRSQYSAPRRYSAYTDQEAAMILQKCLRKRAEKKRPHRRLSKINAVQTLLDHVVSPPAMRPKSLRRPTSAKGPLLATGSHELAERVKPSVGTDRALKEKARSAIRSARSSPSSTRSSPASARPPRWIKPKDAVLPKNKRRPRARTDGSPTAARRGGPSRSDSESTGSAPPSPKDVSEMLLSTSDELRKSVCGP